MITVVLKMQKIRSTPTSKLLRIRHKSVSLRTSAKASPLQRIQVQKNTFCTLTDDSISHASAYCCPFFRVYCPQSSRSAPASSQPPTISITRVTNPTTAKNAMISPACVSSKKCRLIDGEFAPLGKFKSLFFKPNYF